MSAFEALKAQLTAFVQDEDGLTATEYAVLFIVVLVAVVAGAQLLGGRISALFTSGANAW